MGMSQSACRTCSTPFFPRSTNQIRPLKLSFIKSEFVDISNILAGSLNNSLRILVSKVRDFLFL